MSAKFASTNIPVVWLAVLAIAIGLVLRGVQYAAGASLWLDEIALVKAIESNNLFDLLVQPLPFDQLAPKGFLFVEKLVSLAFGASDYALRLFPFVCSLAALLAFARLAAIVLPGAGAGVAMLLFAMAAPLVSFSAIVKQYSSDVTAAILLTLLACELAMRPLNARKAWFLAIAGAVLPWFSQGVALVVAGVALPILVRAGRPDAQWRSRALIVGIWVASALAMTAVAVASMSAETRQYMHAFWAGGFPPGSFAGAFAAAWPWQNVRLLFGFGAQASLAYPFAPAYATLATIGCGVLWVRQRRTAAILIGPIIATLGAAVVGQYPFMDRLILFLVPALILAIAAAVAALYEYVARYSQPTAVLVAACLVLPTAYPVAATPPPYRIEPVKTVLQQLQVAHRPGDAVYVYYGAAPGVSAYAEKFGLSEADYAVGGCHRGDSRRYLEELDNFRGRARVWLILAHALPRYRERDDILAYLDAIGTREQLIRAEARSADWDPQPAEAVLYDLSAPERPGEALAGTFALTGPASQEPATRCGRGPLGMVRSEFECLDSPAQGCRMVETAAAQPH